MTTPLPTVPPRPRKGIEKPRKTATLVAQRIVREIADGQLAPGTPLLSEREMLAEYGVARGTLREALRFLEIQGVLSIKTGPGGGPVVNERSASNIANIIALFLQLEGAPFRAVVEARMVLEPTLAGKAALRITDEQIDALHDSLERGRDAIDDEEAFLAENDVFHALIAHAAGNQVFEMLILSLKWISHGGPLGVRYTERSRKAVCAEHARIYQALRARDSDRASAAMAGHVGDFAAYLERYYPQLMDAPVRWDEFQ